MLNWRSLICFSDVWRKTKGICKLSNLRKVLQMENLGLSPLKAAVPITEEQTPINFHQPENMQPQADAVGF